MGIEEMIILAGWALFGLVVLFVWQRVAPQNWRLGGGVPGAHKVSVLTVIFAVLLTLTVIFFFTQIWQDLGDFVKGDFRYPNYVDRYMYQTEEEFQKAYQDYLVAQETYNKNRAAIELQALFIHTAFVVPVVILALVVFMVFYGRGTAYAAVTLPYFIGAVVVVIRLLFDAGSWVISSYQKLGIYIVLGTLLVIFSILVVVIQNWWQRRHESNIVVPPSTPPAPPTNTPFNI